MKQTVFRSDFDKAFKEIRPNNFTNQGLDALYACFMDFEESTGEEIELDVIAICCEYSEYETAYEAMEQYQPEDMPVEGDDGDDLLEVQEKNEAEALRWLQEQTQVIEFDGGIIIRQF